MPDYAAFLSYAHRYRPWVEVLQRNLEACLAAAGAKPWRIFLDETDLASGRSWVGQLQAGLSRSGQFILVVTPEALASPRVADEWQSFIAARRDWTAAGHLHVVELVETPLPPFLEQQQRLDFRAAGAERYRGELGKLAAGLLGRTDPRDLVAPPKTLEVPPPPDPGLPPELRQRFVEWLAPALADKTIRQVIALNLRLNPAELDIAAHGTWTCAASAALVAATGDDEPVPATLRILETLSGALDEAPQAHVSRLAPLRAELQALVNQGPARGLLVRWLDQVAAEHGRLVPYFEEQGGIRAARAAPGRAPRRGPRARLRAPLRPPRAAPGP